VSGHVYFYGRRGTGNRVVVSSPQFTRKADAEAWGDRVGAEARGLSAFRVPNRSGARPNPPKGKRGGRVSFHGMYTRRADALAKKRKVPGARIEARTVRGVKRWMVVQPLGARRQRRAPASNPRRPTEIYAHLREIVATKGPGHLNCDAACKRARHTYRHVFTSGPPVLGLADGSLEIPAA